MNTSKEKVSSHYQYLPRISISVNIYKIICYNLKKYQGIFLQILQLFSGHHLFTILMGGP